MTLTSIACCALVVYVFGVAVLVWFGHRLHRFRKATASEPPPARETAPNVTGRPHLRIVRSANFQKD